MAKQTMDVSKGEFARLINVTPGRVSQYLAAGKIHGAAIIGEGRDARINYELACAQLRLTRDPDQAHANGLRTTLTAAAPEAAPPTTVPAPALIDDNPLERQLLEHKVVKAERENREASRNEAMANGQLVDAADARRAVSREIGQLMLRFDGTLSELADDLASEFKLPSRDVLHKLKASWRRIRQAAAIEARERAEPMPDSVGHELVEEP